GLTGGREISHVLAFIFTFMLKNATGDEAPKSSYFQMKSQKGFHEKRLGSTTYRGQHNSSSSNSISERSQEVPLDQSCFKYEPSVNLCMSDIFAASIHPSYAKTNVTLRGSNISVPQMWIQTSGSKSSSLSSCQSGKKFGKKRRKRYSKCIPLVNSDSEGDENPKSSRLSKALVKFTMNPNDFDYFTHVVYSDEDKCHETETDQTTSGAPSEKICIHENSLCLSVKELLRCIISIQTQLTVHEAELKHLSSPLLATHDILQFSLDTFTSMISELKLLEEKRDEVMDMQMVLMGMIKLVFSSVQRFLKSSDLLLTITGMCVVPKLLNLVSILLDFRNDPVNIVRNDADLRTRVKNETNVLDVTRACLAHEIVVGLLFMLQSCTCLKVEWKDVWQCLHLHKIFLQNNGPEITKKVIFLSHLLSLNKRTEVLNSLSKLVLYMKYWREDVYHSEKCDKKTHRFCEYQAVQNHHSQVLGTSSCIIKTIDPNACMVSNFVCVLLDCFASSEEHEIYASSIKALTKCGLCCCMTTRMIFSKLLQEFVCNIPQIVSYVTVFIENIVWRDLSGYMMADTIRCAFCQMPEHLGGGVNPFCAEFASDESFSLTFGAKDKGCFHQYKNYHIEAHDHNSSVSSSHWEGIALYKKFLFDTGISSKIMGHIIRLISQSSVEVKLEMCEYLIVPVLKQICDQGIQNYLTSAEYEKEVLVGLMKCYRLTLADSCDQKLIKFLECYGSGLITVCKEIPDIRHEAFALLCNVVKKELKTKPDMPVLSDKDEENNLVFTKMFEWEVIEHDEFWSAYFGMKAEEVRQRFFIHTRINVERNMQECKENSKHMDQGVAEYEQKNYVAKESSVMVEEAVEEERGRIYGDTDVAQEAESETAKINLSPESPHSSTSLSCALDALTTGEIVTEETLVNDTSSIQLPTSRSLCEDPVEDGEIYTREPEVSAGSPQLSVSQSTSVDTLKDDENGSKKLHISAGSSQPSTSKSTSVDTVKEAESFATKKTTVNARSSIDESDEEGIKKMNMELLVIRYEGLGELWAAITEVLQTSTEFQAYLAASSVRSLVAPLLINITQDLARSSSEDFVASKGWLNWFKVRANGVWKKLCPQFVHDFRGFADDVGEVTQTVVDLGNQLQLDIHEDDVTQMLESHAEELNNEDLNKLEKQILSKEDETPEPKYTEPHQCGLGATVCYVLTRLHVETLLNELRSPLLRYYPRTCADVKHLVSVMLQCCVLSTSASITYALPHPTQHALELLDEDTGPGGEGGEHQADETDGYEADTEQLANACPSSTRSLHEEEDLECPELVLLALDLIISHHERFLESQEEAQQEADSRAQNRSRAEDQPLPEDHRILESNSGTDKHSGVVHSEADDHSEDNIHFLYDNQSGNEKHPVCDDLSQHDDQHENLSVTEDHSHTEDQVIVEDQSLPEKQDTAEDQSLLDKDQPLTVDQSIIENQSAAEDQSPAEDPSAAEDQPLTEDQPVFEDQSPAEDPSAAEDQPLTEDQSLAEDQSVAEDQPLTEDEPVFEDQSIAEDQSLAEDQSVAEDQPLTEDKPVFEDQSIAEDKPIAEDQRLAEDKLMADNQPVIKDQHDKKIVKNKKRNLREGIRPKSKRSLTQSTSVAESNSSASSVYHTLHSDEDGSAEEQASDWEDGLCRGDGRSDVTSSTVVENSTGSVNARSTNSSSGEVIHTKYCRDGLKGLKVINGLPGANVQSGSVVENKPLDVPCSEAASSSQVSHSGSFSRSLSGYGLCSESEVAHSASLTQCVHALLLLCRSSASVCRRLHSLGFLSRLLDGFNDLISVNTPDYQ
ncbi:Ovarian abundant message protein-like 1, partial [Homarus americanus]